MKLLILIGTICFLAITVAAQQPTPSPTPGIKEELTVHISADTEQQARTSIQDRRHDRRTGRCGIGRIFR